MIKTVIVIGVLSYYGLAPTVGTLDYRINESRQIDPYADYDFYISTKNDYVGCEVVMFVGDEIFDGVVFDASGHIETSEWMDWDRQDYLNVPIEDSVFYYALIAGEIDYWFAERRPDLIREQVMLEIDLESCNGE